MTTITFIGYGEAGGILADALAKENPVTVWDCKFNGPERDAMIMKARQGGVQAAISLADTLTGADHRHRRIRVRCRVTSSPADGG